MILFVVSAIIISWWVLSVMILSVSVMILFVVSVVIFFMVSAVISLRQAFVHD
jgi:hypothetical protein